MDRFRLRQNPFAGPVDTDTVRLETSSYMAKLSVRDLDVSGKRVLMRVDYNVPMEEKDGAMVINDTTRIKETLPTLNLLVSKGARVILAAHLGRPDGKREPSMSLAPVAVKLGEMLGKPVAFVDETVGEKAEAAANALKDGEILLRLLVGRVLELEENEAVDVVRVRLGGAGCGDADEVLARHLARGDELALGPVASGEVVKHLHKPVLFQPGCKLISREIIGKQIFDTLKPGLCCRLKTVEKRHLGEEHGEIGGKARHGRVL